MPELFQSFGTVGGGAGGRVGKNLIEAFKRQPLPHLAPFTFVLFFSAKKQACGPEGRVLRAKSIGGKRIPYGDPLLLPQEEAGPWAIHRIAPTRIQTGDVVLALCPPGPRNDARLMVFARNALASGPGNARNSIRLTSTC